MEFGDLTEFFKEGSGSGPAKLDWLHVNEKDYQAADRLPKQNLDVTPDLKSLWSHEDKPSTGFVPNTGAPRTMGDLSQIHGPMRKSPEDLVRTARLAIMQTTDPSRIQFALSSRYDTDAIKTARTALAGVFAERGLLGCYYIDAQDFPECHTGSKKAAEFVRRFANGARFLKAKDECTSCIHHQGGDHCGVFHKQIVLDVPYTAEMAAKVETLQAKGSVQASVADPKERIRRAFLIQNGSAPVAAFSGRPQAGLPKVAQGDAEAQLNAVASITKQNEQEAQQKLAAQQARPIVAMLRREMLKGRSKEELSTALRLAFDERDLRATKAEWAPVYRQAGLFGAIYSTQESFDDCREGADFLAKHSSMVRAIVAGAKCESCIFSKMSRCLMYGRKLVANASEVVTADTVQQVLGEHKIAGRLPIGAERMAWGDDPAAALQAIHEAAMSPKPIASGSTRMAIERGFHGGSPRSVEASDVTKRTIVQAMQQYMNEGLYGQDLVAVLRSRFEVRDLASVRADMRVLLAEQGLQGIKYIDPRVYDDYGTGCREAARKHRSRAAVRYAKVGEKCASCVQQTRPGYCSGLNKQLVVEPPYIDKQAEQQAIMATGRSTEVPFASLVNNGLAMMHEYQLQHQSSTLDLNPETKKVEASIEFGAGDQKVKL